MTVMRGGRIFLGATALALVLSACQGTETQRSTGEYVDDATITAAVKTELLKNDMTAGRQIDVESFRGAVQLNGYVESEEARAEAGEIARAVDGVQDVDNNLEVREKGSSSVGQYIDDAALTAKVKTALLADSRTKSYQISVESHDATVQLGGWVDSDDARHAAEEIVAAVNGVKEVDNELQVRE